MAEMHAFTRVHGTAVDEKAEVAKAVKVVSAIPKAKEMETLALISALMLTVAGGGLFAGNGLAEESYFLGVDAREWSIISFCVATFCFMASAMISSVLMIIFLSKEDTVTQSDVKEKMGFLWDMPKVYFVAGYVMMVVGATCFFLCLVPAHATWGCLAFCTAFMIAPTFLALWRGVALLPSGKED